MVPEVSFIFLRIFGFFVLEIQINYNIFWLIERLSTKSYNYVSVFLHYNLLNIVSDPTGVQSIRSGRNWRFIDEKSGHEMKWSAGKIMIRVSYSKYELTTRGGIISNWKQYMESNVQCGESPFQWSQPHFSQLKGTVTWNFFILPIYHICCGYARNMYYKIVLLNILI